MPLGLFILHAAMICVAFALLALIVATGNFSRLYAAALWIGVDLLVSLVALLLMPQPHYARYFPGLLRLHSWALVLLLLLMGIDAVRETHPCSRLYFVGFALFGLTRLVQGYMFYELHCSAGLLNSFYGLTFAVIYGGLIAGLFRPVPPLTKPLRKESRGERHPAVLLLARSRTRRL